MGILDDAIREHLDLKRKHGARDAELREIEDEALGSTDQPDPFAAGSELFGDVATAGSAEASTAAASPPGTTAAPPPDFDDEEPTRLAEPELEPFTPEPDLGPGRTLEPFGEAGEEPESLEPIPGQTELPGQDEIPGQERLDEPVESYGPAVDPERTPEPEPLLEPQAAPEPASHSESLEELIAEEEPFPEDSAGPPPDSPVEPGPSADLGGALEVTELDPQPEPESTTEPPSEPESSVPDPPPPPPATGPEPPGRARGRVDVPTQEHPAPGEAGGAPGVPPLDQDTGPELEVEALPEPWPEPAPPEDSGEPQLYDFESDEEVGGSAAEEPADEFDPLGPPDEEAPYLDEEEPYAEEPATGSGAAFEQPGTEVRPAVEEPGTEVRPAAEDEDEEAYEGAPL